MKKMQKKEVPPPEQEADFTLEDYLEITGLFLKKLAKEVQIKALGWLEKQFGENKDESGSS